MIEITLYHPESRYGMPVCLIDGEPVDPAEGFKACLQELGWSYPVAAQHLGKSKAGVGHMVTGNRAVPAEVWNVLMLALEGNLPPNDGG